MGQHDKLVANRKSILPIPTWDIPPIFHRIEAMLGQGGSRATALQELKNTETDDPFRILIGTILSHRTRDENTKQAVERLFSAYADAAHLSVADVGKVQELIKPAGFYRIKAKRIIEVSKRLIENYNGKVPDTLEDLLELPSVGRKTANCVLVYAFGKPAIPVDTHVHRISNRLGIVQTRNPEETEDRLARIIDKKYWIRLNELFVRFGQNICKPLAPRCDVCTLKERCPEYFRIKLRRPS